MVPLNICNAMGCVALAITSCDGAVIRNALIDRSDDTKYLFYFTLFEIVEISCYMVYFLSRVFGA